MVERGLKSWCFVEFLNEFLFFRGVPAQLAGCFGIDNTSPPQTTPLTGVLSVRGGWTGFLVAPCDAFISGVWEVFMLKKDPFLLRNEWENH